MARKTSINIKPCNIGNSEAHNRRLAQYLARILKEKFYIRTDLMAKNEAWVAPELGKNSLTDRYDQIAAMVKEKTGRAIQTKERIRVNKKTGGVTVVRGCTPLKEGVVVIKEDTKMEQLQRFCEVCKQRWGITALQVFIHRDEGHYGIPGNNATWTPNFHAHIVWDWMNHETGKSCKLGKEDMSEMQTLLAECLEMERGSSKEITGKKHLERDDFIIAKQKQEAERAKAEKEAAIADRKKAEAEREKKVEAIDEAKSKIERLDEETRIKERISSELDGEIAEKRNKANTESGNAILSGIASLAGRGKYAEIAKENERLKTALTEAGRKHPDKYNALVDKHNAQLSARQKVEKELADYRRGEADRIDKAVVKRTGEMQTQIEELEAKAKRKNELLDYLAAIFIRLDELFRKAVKAIIHFAQSGFGGKHGGSGHQDFFTNEEASLIKGTMIRIAGEDGNHRAVGDWLVQVAAAAEELDGNEIRRAQKEVDSVALGEYDWRMERDSNGLKR